MNRLWLLSLAAVVVFGTSAMAQADSNKAQDQALACVAGLSNGSDWNECLSILFDPCAAETVGSERHLSCLSGELTGWEARFEAEHAAVSEELSADANVELGQILSQWFGHLGQKCGAVAEAKAAISADAARAGCEITEIAVATAEFIACQNDQSDAPYCVKKD